MIKGIRYYSFMGSCGYGEAALAYMQCLLDQGIALRWSPLVWTQWGMAPWHLLPEEMRPSNNEIAEGMQSHAGLMQNLEQDIDYDTVFLHSAPELWPKLVEAGKVNIGYTVWETDRLPLHWPEVLKSVDHICVPCEYNRDLFTIEQGSSVSVVPHAISKPLLKCTDQDCRAFKHQHGITDDMYVFYTIATWDPRKAMRETLQAFLQAFDADDNVCLLVKTDEKGYLENSGIKIPVEKIVGDIIAEYSAAAKVVLIAEQISESDIQLIHEIGGCFFSLTHSEGWGLGAFDAAAAGNPVIITGWGGQLDYLPVEDSYQVQYILKGLKASSRWAFYDHSQQWAYADRDDAIQQLRHCYQNREEAKAKGLQLQAFVNNRFSTDQVAADLLRAINDAHS